MATKTGKKSSKSPQAAPAPMVAEIKLPGDEGLERTILGSIILQNDLYYEVAASKIVREDFHWDSHRRIWAAIDDMASDRIPVDLVTLNHYLSGTGELEAAGGVAYLGGLIDGVPDKSNIGSYVEILKDHALRRNTVFMANRLLAMAIDKGDPIKFTLAGAHEDLLRLQGDAQQKRIFQARDFIGEVLADIRAKMDFAPGATVGLPFGLEELDESTTGMREGQLIVVAGTPKSGKTSLAIDIARKIVKRSIPVAFFSREMLKEELMERILAQESDVSYTKIRKPANLSTSEFRLLERTRKEIDNWPLYIDDNATHISEIVPRAHLLIKKEKVELVVVDYVQIVGAPGEKQFERVAFAANELTALAKTTKVPVLCLSQLTIPGTEKKNPWNVIPTMAMLRESGQIAQNAHLILFTYHPRDENTGDPTGEDLVIIGEQRAGPIGRCKAWFNVGVQRWEERGSRAAEPKSVQAALPGVSG